MAPRISTDDGAIQSGVGDGRSNLDAANATAGRTAPTANVHPMLNATVDDADAQNRKAADRVGDGIDRTGRDSAGKTDIDRAGARNVDGIGGAGSGNAGNGGNSGGAGGGAGRALLGSLGSALMGAGGGAPAAAAPQAMPQMPPMPQVPAATAGQSLPMSLSNPVVAQLISKLIGGGGDGALSAGGVGGLSTAGGRGGGSGLIGPSGSGSDRFENKLLARAHQLVGANIPYVWGGGHGAAPGFSQGVRDGGAADRCGDYRKVGLDCAGLARYLIHDATGVDIGRSTYDQYPHGVTVSASQAKPGDLVFSEFDARGPGHVMVYVGGGKAIEAQQSGTNLMFSDVRGSVFKRYVNH